VNEIYTWYKGRDNAAEDYKDRRNNVVGGYVGLWLTPRLSGLTEDQALRAINYIYENSDLLLKSSVDPRITQLGLSTADPSVAPAIAQLGANHAAILENTKAWLERPRGQRLGRVSCAGMNAQHQVITQTGV
jgi:hypothetical protein